MSQIPQDIDSDSSPKNHSIRLIFSAFILALILGSLFGFYVLNSELIELVMKPRIIK
jgi:hypothetical protein